MSASATSLENKTSRSKGFRRYHLASRSCCYNVHASLVVRTDPPRACGMYVFEGRFPLSLVDHLDGLVVKASASRVADPGFESRLSSHTSDLKLGTPVAIPCQAPDVVGSALGLFGPVSVYCDCVR